MAGKKADNRKVELTELLERLKLPCRKLDLLDEALTHSSYAAEHAGVRDFERLEFFGDAVLKFVVSEYLFEQFPHLDEGELTEIRAVLVSGKKLEKVGKSFELERYIRVGRGVGLRSSIIARSMEAVLGAIYQDSGFKHVYRFITDVICDEAETISQDSVKENYKARLQQITQSRAQGTPVYSVVSVEGPPHDPIFSVAVLVSNEVMAQASGRSKKVAEQNAAKLAIEKLL